MAQEDCYVIGIDFGTTYSGVAWCWSGQPENIQLVTRWKTRLNFTQDNAKTPTAICYDEEDENVINWGYDIPPDVEPISWFKLLLVDDEYLTTDLRQSAQIKRAGQMVKELGKSAIQVVADYLRLLWRHVVEDIIRDRGSSAFKGLPLKVWITVPAIWDDNARKRMRQAARMAGILEHRTAGETTVELVAEPEAAAMAVLDDFQKRPDIQTDDIFIVCDAGGGTVDIISYSILDTNPVTVRECVEGKGKMCGAIFVDEAFENMLRASLGERWRRLSDASKKTLMNNEWEFGIKRLFDDSDNEWSVQVPLEALSHSRFKLNRWDDEKGEIPMKEGQLKFRKGHIRAFFETVIPHIRGLVHDQIKKIREIHNKCPKAILLVGGLGSCNYLFQQLRREFEPKNIDVLQPSGVRPWTAICRGALICGLSNSAVQAKQAMVVSRVSRVNYAVKKNSAYREGTHDPDDKYWDDAELNWKARNQMDWYLRRGDIVYTKDPVRFHYHRLFDERPRSISFAIYHNNELDAPSRKTDAVKLLRTIRFRVRPPFDQFPEWTNSNGTVYRKINFSVEMTSTGVSLTWKVLIKGEEMCSEDVEILNE